MPYTLYDPDQDNYPDKPYRDPTDPITYAYHTNPVICSDPKFIPAYVMPWNIGYVPIHRNTPIQKIIQIKNFTK